MKLDMTFEESNQRIDMTFAEIQTASDGGFERGYEQGYTEGKQTEYDRFWDSYQENGNRTSYKGAFGGSGWKEENFKPKYDIICKSNSYNMFEDCGMECSLTELLNQAGIQMKFVNNSYFSATFFNSNFTEIDFVFEFDEIPSTIATPFNGCQKLETLKISTLYKECKIGNTCFQNCIALVNLTIVGEVGKSINLQWSNLLSVESAKNIIQCLANYKGTSSDLANTVTFHANVWSALEAEGNTSPNGNTWREYVYDLGWNKG